MCRIVVIAAALVAAAGCQQSNPTTQPAAPQKKTDIHIETPRANIDIHGSGTGK